MSLVSERTANRRQGGDVGAADGSGPSGPWQRLVRVILNEVGDSGHLLKTNAPPHGSLAGWVVASAYLDSDVEI